MEIFFSITCVDDDNISNSIAQKLQWFNELIPHNTPSNSEQN